VSQQFSPADRLVTPGQRRGSWQRSRSGHDAAAAERAPRNPRVQRTWRSRRQRLTPATEPASHPCRPGAVLRRRRRLTHPQHPSISLWGSVGRFSLPYWETGLKPVVGSARSPSGRGGTAPKGQGSRSSPARQRVSPPSRSACRQAGRRAASACDRSPLAPTWRHPSSQDVWSTTPERILRGPEVHLRTPGIRFRTPEVFFRTPEVYFRPRLRR
jgi:hypothetical protein